MARNRRQELKRKSVIPKKKKTKTAPAPGGATTAAPVPAARVVPIAPRPIARESPPPGEESVRKPLPFPVVGIGASAGGLDAFKRFLAAMPANSGMAFVLVPHLDPTHESLMVELLAKQTQMEVLEAGHGTAIEPNKVYIIPPNRYLAIRNGALELSSPPNTRGMYTSIDFALRSLAKDQREKAIAIVFSGTGSHGSAGIKEIKAAGGMVMAQNPDSAEYEQMPRNAIATGMVDYVLRPEEMPQALIGYVNHPYLHGEAETTDPDESSAALKRLLAVLHTRTKSDFRAYRKSMILRRVQRRMGLLHVDSIDDYLERLRTQPDEVTELHKDLLISVTTFFREPEAFEVLAQQIFPEFARRAESDQPVRLWVCGCATGEEAYSLAILLVEAFSALRKSPSMQIFATDIDETSLEVARAGIYTDSIRSDVSAERLQRFFTKVDDQRYQVSKQLRDSIVFAPQNLLADPPFSRLDMVTCRNVLIYLEPDVQAKALLLFHFALKQGGYLMLGPSESVGRAVNLYEPVAKKWRIYRRVSPARPSRIELPLGAGRVRGAVRGAESAETRGGARFGEVIRQALAHFAPASVLVNRNYEILAMQGPLIDYLEFPPGEPTLNLLEFLRAGLRTKVRAACQSAIEGNLTVTDSSARVRRNGLYYPCTIMVRLISEPPEARGSLLVVFQDHVRSRPESRGKRAADEAALVRQMEDELKATREDLQGTIEELESANEELKASNEEVMSMNEELQSANEELESSKEELQSLNEELSTVNSQLQEKVDELDRANADLTSLLDNTEIATLFLDTKLCVKRFTPTITRVLALRGSDVGRPIAELATHLRGDTWLADCRRALEKLTTVERQVEAVSGEVFIQRCFPYHVAGNRIEGLIVTFTDVSQLSEALQALRDAREAEAYKTVVDHLPVAAMFVSNAAVHINKAAEALTGYRQGEVPPAEQWFAALFGARREEVAAAAKPAQGNGAPEALLTTMRDRNGREQSVEVRSVRVDDLRIMVMLAPGARQ